MQVGDRHKITSPLVRAMLYDTNIMQGDGDGQYSLSGIAQWTTQQKGTPDSSAASQLNWARAFNGRRKWVFQNSPDGGWERDLYRYGRGVNVTGLTCIGRHLGLIY